MTHKSSRNVMQHGVTLVELLVAMVIGLLLAGTVIGLYFNTSSARKQSVAAAEMNEDGLYALKLLSTQIRFAGFNPVQPGRATAGGVTSPATNPLAVDGLTATASQTLGVFGCDTGFANGVSTSSGYDKTASFQLTCSAAGTTTLPAAIAITYEADRFNTVPTAANVPTDCLGNGLQQLTARKSNGDFISNYYVVENRFYVDNNELYCVGSGGTSTFVAQQSIVQNVEDLQFTYGTVPPGASNTSTLVAGYLTSAELGSALGIDGTAISSLNTFTAPVRWGKVVTVRICVLMRSATQVLSEPQPYQTCDPSADVATANDRYLRRAYVTTVNLRNRISLSTASGAP
jgi:type IV pilus assembly protein PilW